MDTIWELDEQEAAAAVARLMQVIALSPNQDGAPHVDFLKQAGYVVAPVEHSGTLSAEIAKTFYDAMRSSQTAPLTAIGLYNPEEQHCYGVAPTLEGLEALRGTSCGVINFALCGGQGESGGPEWVILFDSQLYIGYGPKPFVRALAGDVAAAFAAVQSKVDTLQKEAKSEDVPGYAIAEMERLSSYLSAALEKLQKNYSQANAGEMVNIV